MGFAAFCAVLLIAQYQTLVLAAPSIEPCPHDSVLTEADICKCDLSTCAKPPCLSELVQTTKGTDLPGSCCPSYSCEGCRNDTLIDGKCPCAPEAVLNFNSECECFDKEKHLVNSECVCNPLQCELPTLCDQKSVAVTKTVGCCKRTVCKTCPTDSEPTNFESDDLEDHCVCLPCTKNECNGNRTVVIKRFGNQMPGSCCDLYECKELDSERSCSAGKIVYQHGEEWKEKQQICKCQNGLALCSKTLELDKKSQSCLEEDIIYKHLDRWTKEDGCTTCTCRDGDKHCISHFCEFKESRIGKNDTSSCVSNGHLRDNLQSWTEVDGCTYCTCMGGEVKCTKDFCEKERKGNKVECQPLAGCNKTCVNGFKINRKGCEICKCSNGKVWQEILNKYNLTMNDLIEILDERDRLRTKTTTSATTSSRPTIVNETELINIIKNGEKEERVEERVVVKSTTTTEPSVVPTDKLSNNISWIYIVASIIFGFALLIMTGVTCFVKSKRKSSLDLTHCQYETVNNNNITIKKTDQLL